MERRDTCNTYMNIETSPGKVECTYTIGEIKKIEVTTPDYNTNVSYVNVFVKNDIYSWQTNNIYLVGYMMYGVPVSKDGQYLFAQQDMRGLYCLNAKTGEIVWKTKSKAEISHVLVLDKHLCCSKGRDEIQLIDIHSGEVVNSYKTPYDNRFEVINDEYILNHTRSKCWEIISSKTLEIVRSISDKELYTIRHTLPQLYQQNNN